MAAAEPESQGPTVNAISIVFAIITAVVMLARLYARVFLVQKLGLDDGEFTTCFLVDTCFD